MNFKNLVIYEIKNDSNIGLIDETLLNKIAFAPCSDYDFSKMGFTSPYGNDKLMLQVKEQVLITVQQETKIIPTSAVTKALNERIALYEKKVGHKPTKSEKANLKDEVMAELLPRAFSRFTPISIWINKRDKYLAVVTSSFKKAEDCLALLRKELGSLDISPFWFSETPINTILTRWVKRGQIDENFELGNSLVLKDALETQNVIKVLNENFENYDFKNLIDNSVKSVVSLEIVHNKLIDLKINDNDLLTNIRINSSVFDNVEYDPVEEHDLKLEADFAITADVLSKLIQNLKAAME